MLISKTVFVLFEKTFVALLLKTPLLQHEATASMAVLAMKFNNQLTDNQQCCLGYLFTVYLQFIEIIILKTILEAKLLLKNHNEHLKHCVNVCKAIHVQGYLAILLFTHKWYSCFFNTLLLALFYNKYLHFYLTFTLLRS